MCDEWMPMIRLPISIDEFHQLPRNAAYKYEYFGGKAMLSPRPKTMHAALDLATCSIPLEDHAPTDEYALAPLERQSQDELAKVFCGAFGQSQPFAGLPVDRRLAAARESLRRAFDGEEGPWLADASFVARRIADNAIVGAIVLTLIPDGDPSDVLTYRWPNAKSPTPEPFGAGQPHITWIFTAHFFKGEGIGTRLLAAAVDALRIAGHKRLLTTFIMGNDSSMLWHWRNGFTLLPGPISKRRIRRKIKP
jgi:GNAT superfamily N-acetyltransferase